MGVRETKTLDEGGWGLVFKVGEQRKRRGEEVGRGLSEDPSHTLGRKGHHHRY